MRVYGAMESFGSTRRNSPTSPIDGAREPNYEWQWLHIKLKKSLGKCSLSSGIFRRIVNSLILSHICRELSGRCISPRFQRG